MVAFTLVWAYVACLLWLPRATDGAMFWLYLFPPGYFFVVGGFFGLLHEGLVRRCPRVRVWVSLAMLALSVELGIYIYGGHRVGLSLGLLFAAATLCASLATPYLRRARGLLASGALLGALLALAWLLAPWVGEDIPDKVRVSPDGAFIAWLGTNDHGTPGTIHVGPRYGWNGAFGRDQTTLWSDEAGNYRTTAYKLEWIAPRTLKFYGEDNDSLPKPSELLPIRIETAPDERRP
jgi:hypothetical protein